MEPLNIDPNKCYLLEIIIKNFDEEEPTTIPNLTIEQCREYYDRMEPDADFQFFRVWPDGSHTEIEFV